MDNNEVRIYNEELGLDGTIAELIDWAYRYDGDYSDEALDEIAKQAKILGLPEEKATIPTLVKLDRQRTARKDGTLPYEQLKLDRLIYGKISYSSTQEYGEVEIFEEGDKVLISVSGADEEGIFTAANTYPTDEFMAGDERWLEQAIGSTLFYGKIYQ